jgi:hypothetical protein
MCHTGTPVASMAACVIFSASNQSLKRQQIGVDAENWRTCSGTGDDGNLSAEEVEESRKLAKLRVEKREV